MSDGLRIPGVGVLIAQGNVVNKSSGVVLCWVQDDDKMEIFQLGPGRSSPSDRDVDAVRAERPCTMKGTDRWFKFSDINTANVYDSDKPRDLDLDFTFGNPSGSLSDEEMLKKGGFDPATTSVDSFLVRGSAIWWGRKI